MENDGLLLKYKNNQRLLIREGIIYLLSLEKPEGEYELYQLSYSEEGNWGDDDGKTITYFKSVISPESFDLDSTEELANGKRVEFRTNEYEYDDTRFWSYYLMFAFVDGKCASHYKTDAHEDTDSLADVAHEFDQWRSRVMEMLNKVGGNVDDSANPNN